jgi:hypothetical protein
MALQVARSFLLGMSLGLLGCVAQREVGKDPLVAVDVVPLGGITGRMDHLAYDPGSQRVFVAALAAGQVLAVDANTRSVVAVARNVPEPQGIAVLPAGDRIVVGCGGDGSLRSFTTDALQPLASLYVGGDADNVRVDAVAQRAYVGIEGGLAVLSLPDLVLCGVFGFPGHAESFQLDPLRGSIYVNVPKPMAKVVVLDAKTGAPKSSWRGLAGANYPMAFDLKRGRIYVGYRGDACIAVLDAVAGDQIQRVAAASDLDDVFVDASRSLLYAIGGEGFVDVFAIAPEGVLTRIQRVETAVGARTGLFLAERGELWVAVPRREEHPAELRIFRAEG